MGAAEASARRAVALDAIDAEARAVLSGTLGGRGDMTGALIEAEHARSLSPNLASAHGALSMLLIYSGRAREGSIRLDPHDPRSAARMNQMALAFLFLARIRGGHRGGEPRNPVIPGFSAAVPLARCRSRPARSDRRSERSAGECGRGRAGRVRHVCPRARAVDAAGRLRSHARRSAQGRLAGLAERAPPVPPVKRELASLLRSW